MGRATGIGSKDVTSLVTIYEKIIGVSVGEASS
jgi:hypothetical protein